MKGTNMALLHLVTGTTGGYVPHEGTHPEAAIHQDRMGRGLYH